MKFSQLQEQMSFTRFPGILENQKQVLVLLEKKNLDFQPIKSQLVTYLSQHENDYNVGHVGNKFKPENCIHQRFAEIIFPRLNI